MNLFLKSLNLFLAFSLLWSGLSQAQVSAEKVKSADLQKTLWEYVGFIYQNHRYEKTDPALRVRFDFKSDHLVSLYWFRDNDPMKCHRIAEYRVDNEEQLYQKIIWVDPQNSMECSKDPDMQMGRESLNKIKIVGSELFLYLELSGEEFIYILEPKEYESSTIFKHLHFSN